MISPNGRDLARIEDGVVQLWELAPNGVLSSNTVLGSTADPGATFNAVFFSPDGTQLAAATTNFTIKLCEQASRRELQTFTGHTEAISSIAFHPGGREIASVAKKERLIRIWDTADGTELRRLSPELGGAWKLAYSPDGRWLVVVEARKDVHILDSRTGEVICKLPRHFTPVHAGTISDIQFSPDGHHLASASEDGMVKIWDATRLSQPQTGRILWPSTAERKLCKIAFSPDSQRLATGDGFNDVVVLDVKTGALALPRLQGHGDTVICVAFSPDGRFLASAGADNTVRLWDARTGKHLNTYFGHTSVINSVAFSLDSRILASGGQDQVIRLWRVEGNRP